MLSIRGYVFDFSSITRPAQVWRALTTPELTPRYFLDLAAYSSWEPGAAVAFRSSGTAGAQGSLQGEVLVAERRRRLSYSINAGGGPANDLLTWEIVEATDESASRVRLYVDETEIAWHDDDEAENLVARYRLGAEDALQPAPRMKVLPNQNANAGSVARTKRRRNEDVLRGPGA